MADLLSLPTQLTKRILRRGVAFIAAHPVLRQHTLTVVRKLGLHSVARKVYTKLAAAIHNLNASSSQAITPTIIAHLTPRARQIHADLKAAIERRQKGNG